jgi:hypothetical protein
MRPGQCNLGEFPAGTYGLRNISSPESFFELFPIKRYKVRILFQKPFSLDKIRRDCAFI